MSYGIEILSPDGYSYVVDGFSCFKFVGKRTLTITRGSGTNTASTSLVLGSDKYLVFVKYKEGTPTRITTSISGTTLTINSRYGAATGTPPSVLSCDVYVFCNYGGEAREPYGVEVYDAAGNIVFNNNSKALSVSFATQAMLPISGGNFAATFTPFSSGQIGVIGQGQPIMGDVIPVASGGTIASGTYVHVILPFPVAVKNSTYSGSFAYIDTTIYD